MLPLPSRAAVALVLASTCSCGAEGVGVGTDRGAATGPATEATAPVPRGESPSSPIEAVGPPQYALHEWGLVQTEEASFSSALSVQVSGRLEVAMIATVLRSGTPIEQWPNADVGGSSIAWTQLSVEPWACPVVAPFGATDSPSLDLGSVGRAADCIRGAHDATPILFQRASDTTFQPPLEAFYLDFGDITVRNRAGLPIPGQVIRIRYDETHLWVGVADPPAPRDALAMGHDGITGMSQEWVDRSGSDLTAAHRLMARSVTATMLGLGLSQDDAAGFLALWGTTLLRPRAPRPHHHHEEEILYFLPPSDGESFTSLSADPAPLEIRRAWAVVTPVR